VEFGQDCTDSDLRKAVGSAMKMLNLKTLLDHQLSKIKKAIDDPRDETPKAQLITRRNNINDIISMAV
jgi:hypothetical protein